MSEPSAVDDAESLFDGYRLGAAWDEMLAGAGDPRTPYKPVFHTLRSMRGATLKERADILARSYLDQGVTFDYAGEERPFPLDAVPRVISAHEWQVIESGVAQRVTALEAFLDDIYSREGEIPRAVHQHVGPRGRRGQEERAPHQKTSPPCHAAVRIHSHLKRKPNPMAAITPPPARMATRPHGHFTSRPNAMPARCSSPVEITNPVA